MYYNRGDCVYQQWHVRFFDVHVTVHRDKFLTIKLTRCTNFSNLFWNETLTRFGQFLCPSSGVFHLHSSGVRHTDFQTDCKQDQDETPWSSILILLESCQKICMTYTIAAYTVKNSWWWTEELSETCRFSYRNKFDILVHLVGFIVRNVVRTFPNNVCVYVYSEVRSVTITFRTSA